MSRSEAMIQYGRALKEGKRYYRSAVSSGQYPYPQVLDEIVDTRLTAGIMNIGTIEIPIERIVGTKTKGRRQAFAGNFMPLLEQESEFGEKWIMLCEANLSQEGLRDPILCYEYLGRFFVQEGNKRVSVLKSFGAPTITAVVRRIIPRPSDDPEIICYYEFMEFYRKSRTYLVRFSKPGQYRKLQLALGHEAEHEWTEWEYREFSGMYFTLSRALSRVSLSKEENLSEIFLYLLQVFGAEKLRAMTETQLITAFERIRPDLALQNQEKQIDVSMGSDSDGSAGVLYRLINSIVPVHISAAFIYECPPEKSPWIRAHELGRSCLLERMSDNVTAVSYTVTSEETADQVMERAVKDGAEVIFAPTPSLMPACRRCAVSHPGVRVLNCSVSMPFPEVRTYYSRIYEGKFISGAVAGALTKTDKLGYVASNPIYGVPAGINAFALGARLTNPDAKVYLRWSSTDVDTFSALRELGVDLISNRDIPTPEQDQDVWGLCRVSPDGAMTPILSPYWNWGEIYVHLIRLILSGAWDDTNVRIGDKAINYWWGISSGAVDVHMAPTAPDSAHELVSMLKLGLETGAVDPFFRKIRAQDGREINDGEHWLAPEDILHMDWLCDNVAGHIPRWDELLPIARNIVKLQGIYREDIPAETGDMQL